MSTSLASPKRLAIALTPVVGIVVTPFLPFVSTPTFVFGIPAAFVWMAAMVIGTVVALQIVERSYLRDGGAALDAAEEALDAARLARLEAHPHEGEGH
ncbi:hypothetical protein SPF06_13005 [Sinomonas sp. JGH33]|uniref:DUF3311 domain-containing protein n=1 Tax=Sinomonas terricola TaxID=3110330 RepID=A0ABU5T7Y0_9MICC|nr:hypothetical protein [Sinomonas sp. JGH33]MEA5455645.1 hypothetical protein [Sinomonas sp. JGH33]